MEDDDSPIRVTIVNGSLRQGRFAPVVSSWVHSRALRRPDLHVTHLDLQDVLTPEHWEQPGRNPVWVDAVAASDAFVVVTPEYNHSAPGLLKHAIDSVNQEWYRKAVSFVCYGGLSGGLRAVESLRLVFAELYATTVRETVSFHGAKKCFTADGLPKEEEIADAAADTMLAELTWWARALRTARKAGVPMPT
ncbi:NADPH-dependent FMN reductase [Lentzea chajnantorensis]